jgi:hypothetical protein
MPANVAMLQEQKFAFVAVVGSLLLIYGQMIDKSRD